MWSYEFVFLDILHFHGSAQDPSVILNHILYFIYSFGNFEAGKAVKFLLSGRS